VVIPAVEAGLQRGMQITQPAERSLQSKEVPHWISISNQEFDIGDPKSAIGYRTAEICNRRSNIKHGSLTTSDILFKNKDDQFRTSAAGRPNR
jgi:hypothetical protein